MSKTKISIVIDHITNNIEQNIYPQNSRLPSLRSMATQLNISKSTIVEAFDRLSAMGIIEAKKGAGFYVKKPNDPTNLIDQDAKSHKLLNALSVTKMFLDIGDDYLKPGSGWLPKDWMPEEMIKKTIRNLLRDDAFDLTAYSSSYGHKELRKTILQQRSFGHHGLELEQIALTNSSTQSIDLICRHFLKEGDVVIIDKPCYFNFHALLNAHKVKIVAVEFEQDGPNIEVFKTLCEQYSPRLYITNGSVHNPTGAKLSAQKCHKILNLVERHNMLIVEDDILADFCPIDSIKYIQMANLDQILYLGSFSKTVSASIRCGYMIGHKKWMSQIMDLQIATNFGNHNFSAAVIHKMLLYGNYQRYIKQLNMRLDKARYYVIKQLEHLKLLPAIIPDSGLYIWVKLPYGMSALKFTQLALEHKIMFTPSDAFFIEEQQDQFLRINIAQSQNQKIFTVMADILSQLQKNID